MKSFPEHERRQLIGQDAHVPISRQCRLLNVPRSTYYYEPCGESPFNLKLMGLIDRLHLDHPEWGRPMMTQNLRRMGYGVNAKRVGRLMRLMNIRSVLPRPNTSKPNEAHEVHPYLLKGLQIKAPNQVWGIDITYIAMAKGFLYLVVILDWYSRYVLSWKLSNHLGPYFCIEALQEAFQYGRPEIFNSDQGAQFTSRRFTGILKDNGIRISMDGKGRAIVSIRASTYCGGLKVGLALLRTKAIESMTKEQRAHRWAGILSRYTEWEGSVRAFCAREGISVASFYHWRRKEAKRAERGFVALRLPTKAAEAPCAGVRLSLGPFGVEVHLPESWDEKRLGRLLKSLL